MRNQHVGRASRVALFAVLLVSLSMWACQDPQQEAPQDATSDLALGVDGDFGVETFALGAPSISFLLPTTTANFFYVNQAGQNLIPGTPCQGAPGSYKCATTGTNCDDGSPTPNQSMCEPFVQLAVSNFQLGVGQGAINCRINGSPATVYTSAPIPQSPATFSGMVPGHTDMVALTSIGYTQGLYNIECVLADASGAELTNAESRAKRAVQLLNDPFDVSSPKCANDADCADGNNCSAEICIAGKCKYTALANCCTDDWFCAPGESCLNPNSATSKCSACTLDLDCDDGVSCTVDSCDQSGITGKCLHTVPAETCCTGFAKCDDGKPCTIDSCDLATSQCVHEQPAGACCADSECPSSDPCKVGGCIALQCRFAVNGDRPDCCSPTTNTFCDDKLSCTLDSCGNAQPGGWTQCKHETDPSKPGCCDIIEDCADGDGCTNDQCINHGCFHTPVQECCASELDCNDNNTCTVDTCDIAAGNTSGACGHAKTPECCNTKADCNDQKFCTADNCNVGTHTCSHLQGDASCCDQDSQCSDGKLCTADLCLNHACLYIKDGNKPNCCEDNSPSTCDDKNACTIDSCKLQGACGGLDPESLDVSISGTVGATPFSAAIGNAYVGQTIKATKTGVLNRVEFMLASTAVGAQMELSIYTAAPDAGGQLLGALSVGTLPPGSGQFQSLTIVTQGNPVVTAGQTYFLMFHGTNATIAAHAYDANINDVYADGGSYSAGSDPAGPWSATQADLSVKTYVAAQQPACAIDNNTCQHVPNGVDGCCNVPTDCDDSDCHTLDVCGSTNLCIHKPNPYTCASDLDCDDGNGATTDACDVSSGCGTCTHTAIAGACVSDAQCDDKVVCTTDTCVANVCQHGTKPQCCTSDVDATTICDDNDSCTIDYCQSNQCHHTAPKNGCCVSNADCFDGNKCTADICDTTKPDGDHFTCKYEIQDPNCSECTVESVVAGLDCNDNNTCTADYCDAANHCHNNPIAECCYDKFDCDDHNDCTFDTCTEQHGCMHTDTLSGVLLCCKPSSQDIDCAYLNTECQKGICVDSGNGNGATKCVAEDQPVCTVNIGYCQPFEGNTSLHSLGWNPMFADQSAPNNWSVAHDGGLGPDGFAKFSWTPTKTDYGTCLQSPVIQAAGAKTITLQYDRAFEWNSNSTQITILGSLDGANADWGSGATVIDTMMASNNFGPETLDVKLPNNLTGSNGLRLAFCMGGTSTFDVTSYTLDNICIVKGSKPAMVACPVNQVVPFNTKKTIPLKAKDPDTDAILSFQLVEGPTFISLSSAIYFWLDKSWNSTLSINPTTTADIGTHNVKIKVSDGALYSLCSFQVTVTYNGGYLVVRPPDVPVELGDALAAGLKAAAPTKVVQHIDDINLYTDLNQFEAVFVTLGVYPSNHQLNGTESAKLQAYLAVGGRLYMEGGDTWAYDPQVPVHASFKVNGLSDSVNEGIAAELLGQSIYRDLTVYIGANPKKYSFGFSFSDAYNNNNDAISAKEEVHRTQNMLQSNGSNDKPWVQVGHDDDAGFRTVASAIPYAGVMTGPVSNDAPVAMLGRILNFFNNGFIDCINDLDCNDIDDCTTDTCVKGECFYANTCSCSSQQQLACGDTIQVVTGGAGSAGANKVYGCDTAVFGGKEMSYTFSTTSSRPATLTVTGSTNAAARVFVIRTVDSVCAAGQCIAETGNGTKNFAAAANEQYYIVVDTPVGTATQLSLTVTCGDPEICNDNSDNNNNGLVDCQDLASCCGDAACGEVCDGVDNNCDGKIDEGCDDDGDGWCDAAMTVTGNPPVCSAGTGDCNDTIGTINPGAPDLCGNNKDDNCSGQTDEPGSANCTNFWVDADKDTFGGGSPVCLCVQDVAHPANKGGDCDDNDKKVNPSLIEICGNAVDDNCDGSQNDQNAQGCTDFYLDLDGDGAGANTIGNTGKQCLCQAAGNYAAEAPGDCNDASKFVHPGATELCNNVDDNCNNLLDEGCDDDVDGYCDATIGYVSIGVTSQICGQGPEGALITLQCEAGRTITAIDFASFGNPTGVCGTYKAGTCSGGSTLQALKTACLGKASCSITAASSLLGDGCAGQAKTLDVQVTCMGSGGAAPGICPLGPGDTNDNDPTINPAGQEICDNIDNNSDGFVDEGCDDDGDHFCDTAMIVIGAPLVCSAGGGDCNDQNGVINPGAQEDCDTADDDDCDGNLNNQDSLNCNVFFSDADNDGYGTKSFKCFCNAVGLFKAKKTADCADNNSLINPGVSESCNGLDDDCDGVIDNGCDADGDGYCAVGKPITAGTNACPNGGGDCDDTAFDVNPGKTEICGDGIDNNCNGSQNDAGALLCQIYYADVDQDGYGIASSKCQCAPSGNFTAQVTGDCNDAAAAVNPAAQEICDDIDNNCSSAIDEQCDKDQDGYCDATKQLVGTPAICTAGGGDCDDTNGNVHPDLAQEVCDNVDDDCDGLVDNGCDKDSDGYCDAAYAVVGLPPVCANGVNDCDDYDNTVNPAAAEVCGNSKDDNCNGSQNDQDATNCKAFYRDGDGDSYGLNSSMCLCTAAGSFTAPAGDDCDDTNAAIHPDQAENCATAFDDNCNLETNDINATGCTDFALDADVDGFGLTALTQCLCVGANQYTALPSAGADCNDADATVNPGAAEKCNDVDDNCLNGVDEGCNDDGDKFCDSAMTTVGFPNICAGGGGDCNDTNAAVNPGAGEKCDGVDNNCSGGGATGIDEGCDDDHDTYCDANMTVVGTPTVCTLGGGDCDDTNAAISPGQTELCSTTWDDNCNGDNNDINATGCTAFGVDLDGDTYSDKNKPTTCYCVAKGTNTGTNAGDCDDQNNLIRPGLTEICDAKDNNCSGAIDEGCNDDGDTYCDSSMTTVGKPSTCINGGGDCNDSNAAINPGASENCASNIDENCSGGNNDVGAIGCTTFYLDNDSDLYGVNVSQCTCIAVGKYVINTATGGLLGDCDDTNVNVNPGKTEVCGDNVDNNCNGTQNDTNASACSLFYLDADKDGYGPSSGGSNCQCFAQGAYVSAITGDCNDANSAINPGMAERCDNLDNNCNGGAGGTDEGCDDDNDDWCDANMVFSGASSTCGAGTGDCDDALATVYPGRAEVCDNVDQNCNSIKDEGCDDDKDSFCDKTMTVVYASNTVCPLTTNALTLDCDDSSAVVNPNKTEICDGLDNNCNGQTDEGCDKDGDKYCDSAMQTVGKPASCIFGGGDCNDTAVTGVAINPGAAELCNGIDDNCVGDVDEVCKDTDHDGFCIGVVVGTPTACPSGGNDCDDSNVNVHPGQPENCSTQYDDNCDGVTNPTTNLFNSTRFYTDADGDGYGIGAGQLSCYQVGLFTSLVNNDCDDTKAIVNPSALEICDGTDNDCKLGIDQGCDDDTDGYCDATMLITSTALCTNSSKPAAGATKQGDDCVDIGTVNGVTASLYNPGKPEQCNNADDNCSGVIDEGCDDDKDGYCDSGMTVSIASPAICPSTTLTGAGNDCNDVNAQVNPGKKENCTTVGVDDNCDGSLNAANADGCTLFYLDADNDGYGVTASTACQCIAATSAPFYRATQGGDCNDASNAIFPGATEICDNKDNNCDAFAQVDEGCDVDKDGYCKAGLTVTVNTICPNQAIGTGNDCNDLDKLINPGATEICDGQDNNCDASFLTDENCNKDGDTYCDAAKVTVGTPAVCTSGGGDCNDAVATGFNVNPGKAELCDGLDNNCNGLTDDSPSNGTLFYYDGDQDGEPINSSKSLCAASGFWSYSVAVKGAPSVFDCDDNGLACGANCNHTLTENRCDTYDNNCNGSVDEGCNGDGDLYCTSAKTTVKNGAGAWPAICASGGGDCNDAQPSIKPNAQELCNLVDDNCNGQTDEQASAACANVFPNATGVCTAGSCVMAACKTGYVDSSPGIAGCECYAVDQYEPNDSTALATSLGTLYDGNGTGGGVSGTGTVLSVQGLVADTNDHDWFVFYGQDYGDGNGACDHYNVRAYFTTAVAGVVFDIYRGPNTSPNLTQNAYSFTTTPLWPNWAGGVSGGVQPQPGPGVATSWNTSASAGWNQVCCAQQDFNWFTYFKDWRGSEGATSHYGEYGECPCSAGDTYAGDYPNDGLYWKAVGVPPASIEWGPLGYRRGPWAGYSQYYDPTTTWANPSQMGGWDYTKCVDDSAYYYIHVYRTSGTTCAQYRMEISNGVYGATGGAGGWGQQLGKNW